MTLPRRAAAMEARLVDTARRLGLDDGEVELLGRAYRLAMTGARSTLDPHHPDFLHPARTALILMDDVGVRHAPTLAAALLAETREAGPGPVAADGAALEPRVLEILRAVPAPADSAGGSLLEALVTAPAPTRLVALAERLDHARHLHLRPRDEWAEYHATTCAVYAPAAARESEILGRRFSWWCGTFRRRFLGS